MQTSTRCTNRQSRASVTARVHAWGQLLADMAELPDITRVAQRSILDDEPARRQLKMLHDACARIVVNIRTVQEVQHD